jgi:predicted PurR-regulated permease PerM
MAKNKQTIEVSFGTILKILLVIFLIVVAFFIRDILAILFFALIIASTINVPVKWLKKYHIPRALGVILTYIFSLVCLGLLVALIVSPLSTELKQFSNFIPRLTSQLSSGMSFFESLVEEQGELQEFFLTLSQRLNQLKINFFSLTGNVMGRIAAFFIVFILSFYLAIEEEGVRKFIRAVTPKDKEDYAISVWERGQRRLSRWLSAELLLGFVVGLLTFVGLTIIGIPYALGLAMLAGLFELIPTVGPILSAIPAILIAFIQSPLMALAALVLYIVVQQLENNLLVPTIMKKTVGLNPVITILVLLIGAKFGGLLGMIIAIPITMLIHEFWQDIFESSSFEKFTKQK